MLYIYCMHMYVLYICDSARQASLNHLSHSCCLKEFSSISRCDKRNRLFRLCSRTLQFNADSIQIHHPKQPTRIPSFECLNRVACVLPATVAMAHLTSIFTPTSIDVMEYMGQ